jgi:O-antigen/teichoic acid export membrane protein
MNITNSIRPGWLWYFIKNGLVTLAGQGVIGVLGVISTILLTRAVSLENYGNFQFYLSGISTLSVLSLPGLNSSVLSAVSLGLDGTYRMALKKRVTFGLWGSLLLLLFAIWNFLNGNQVYMWIGLIGMICFPFLSLGDLVVAFFQGKEFFLAVVMGGVLTSAIELLFYYLLVYRLNFDSAYWLMILYSIAGVISFCGMYFFSKQYIRSKEIQPNWLSYGKFLSSTRAVELITNKLDYLLIGAFFGARELAVYAVGVKFAAKIQNMTRDLLMVTTPKIAKKNSVSKSGYLMIFAVSLILSIILALVAKPVMKFIFPESYGESIYLSQIILLSTPFLVLNNLYTKHFTYFLKERRAIIRQAVLSPVVLVILMIIVAPIYGLTGLAIVNAIRPVVFMAVLLLYAWGNRGKRVVLEVLSRG